MAGLHYTRLETDIGPIFLAATDKGLCSLRLLYNAPEQEAREALGDLEDRFPDVEPREDGKALATLAAQVRSVIAGEAKSSTIPLDMAGTDFQHKVWRALIRIPWGRTCTYAELARKAGLPRAIRAAASACARNPVAFVVPCHRIVASGGGLGGYGYGLSAKRWLLEREQREGGV